jgi:DNA-binding transcriptional regulator YiaG
MFYDQQMRELLNDRGYQRAMELARDSYYLLEVARLANTPAIRQMREAHASPAFQAAMEFANFQQRIERYGYGGSVSTEPKVEVKPNHPGVRVRTLRKQLGWSQKQLADRSRISLRTISGLERLREIPKPATLATITEALENPDSNPELRIPSTSRD